MKAAKRKTGPPFFKYLVLFALPFLIYGRVVGFGFSYHDDDTMIIEGAENLKNYSLYDFLTTDAWMRKAEIELYRPFQSITYAIDYRISGTEPWAYHLHNLVIFCLSIILLFEFLKRIGIGEQIAFWLSLFYSVHYLMAHAVCWIPARGDVYLVFWTLTAILSFYKWRSAEKIYWLVISALAYFFALLSKESAVIIFPLMLALIFYEGWTGMSKRQNIQWVALFGFASATYFHLRSTAIYHSKFVNLTSLAYNLPTIPEEIFKFFVPVHFSVMPGFQVWLTVAGTVISVALLIGLYLLRKQIHLRRAGLGLVLFAFTIGPSVLYKPVFAGYAYDYIDHRMFMCGIGLLIIVGELYSVLLNRNKKAALTGLYVVLFVSSGFAFYYSGSYKDFDSYYSNAVSTNPKSGFAIYNYSSLLASREKRYDKALATIEKAIRMYPQEYMYQRGKAGIAFQKGDFELMRKTADILVKKWPENSFGYSFMGMYEFNKGNYSEALGFFSKAIELNDRDSDSYGNRAKSLQALGRLDEALKDWDHAIEINNGFAEAYFERGNLYGNMENFSQALKDYNTYVTLRPDDPRGYFYRGQALCLTGSKQKGNQDLQMAIRLNQGDDTQIMQVARQLCQ